MVGVDRENRMYLLDLWRGQTSSDVWIEAWCDLVKKCPCEALPLGVAGLSDTLPLGVARLSDTLPDGVKLGNSGVVKAWLASPPVACGVSTPSPPPRPDKVSAAMKGAA
jgi:hypothetical protein